MSASCRVGAMDQTAMALTLTAAGSNQRPEEQGDQLDEGVDYTTLKDFALVNTAVEKLNVRSLH